MLCHKRGILITRMALWRIMQKVLRSLIPFKFSVSTRQNMKQQCGKKVEIKHSPRLMAIVPSRWQWHKFKDLLHLYAMVGLIPVSAIIFYANVFIGPAELANIPDDYIPKHWEYHRHPITRFLARYVFPNPQQEYEKFMHYTFEEDEKAKIRRLEKKIREKMAERNDYQAYYYRPVMAKYCRISKEAADYLYSLRGD